MGRSDLGGGEFFFFLFFFFPWILSLSGSAVQSSAGLL